MNQHPHGGKHSRGWRECNPPEPDNDIKLVDFLLFILAGIMLATWLLMETKNAKRRVYKEGKLVKTDSIPIRKLACEHKDYVFDDHLINNKGERTQ